MPQRKPHRQLGGGSKTLERKIDAVKKSKFEQVEKGLWDSDNEYAAMSVSQYYFIPGVPKSGKYFVADYATQDGKLAGRMSDDSGASLKYDSARAAQKAVKDFLIEQLKKQK